MKKLKQTYENIDMITTGAKLKRMLSSAGYTPKMIQEYLHLSCVQPIYRWYKGMILPSVDNLLMLRELLGVHMEELLVKKSKNVMAYDMEYFGLGISKEYYRAYAEIIYRVVA